MSIPYAVVVPTTGRPSLVDLIEALHQEPGPLPDEIIVVSHIYDQAARLRSYEIAAVWMGGLEGPPKPPVVARGAPAEPERPSIAP